MHRTVWKVLFALVSFNMGTSLLVPILPLYKTHFDLSQTEATLLFVLYVWLLIPAVFFLGQLSDQAGRKRVLIPTFVLLALGDVLFLITWHFQIPALLYLTRIFQGIASGAFWGTGSAFLIDSAGPQGRRQAANLAGISARTGLSLGPGLGGLIAAVATNPYTLPFQVHLVIIAVGILAIMLTPETVRPQKITNWHIQLGVPREDRRLFWRFIAPSAFVMAVLDGMVLSLIPFFVFKVMGLESPGLVGLLGFLTLATGIVSQTVAWRMNPKLSVILGLLVAVPSAYLMIAAAPAGSVAMLVVGSSTIGLGCGLIIKGGVNLTAIIAPPEERGKILSAYYLVAYLGTGGPTFLAAVAADYWGLSTALYVLAGFLSLLTLLIIFWGSITVKEFEDRLRVREAVPAP